MVVGCAFLERRDAVVALIAHAAALLAASLDLTPGLTWKGVGPEQRENMHPWLRRWMSIIAPFGLVLPLISAPWSPPARAHAILLTRRRRRLSARLMRILSGEPTPAEQLATYNDTRQIFAD